MKLKMYCLYDVKTNIYHPPVYCHNPAHAMRVFGGAVADQTSQYYVYAEDFHIMEVGQFDDADASLLPQERVFICSLSDLVQPFKERLSDGKKTD